MSVPASTRVHTDMRPHTCVQMRCACLFLSCTKSSVTLLIPVIKKIMKGMGKKVPVPEEGTQFRRERAHEQSTWMHEYQSALNKIRISNSIFQSGWSVWSGGLRLLPFVFVIVVNYGSATSQWLSRELLILRRRNKPRPSVTTCTISVDIQRQIMTHP